MTLKALLCSAFIPFFSGFMPPTYQGYRYMDGGFTNNVPTIDQFTISVSPFCGESDICPVDNSARLFHVSLLTGYIELLKIIKFLRNKICAPFCNDLTRGFFK